MTDLCLCVTSEDVQIFDLWHPLCLLLSTCKVLNRDTEHRDRQTNTWEESLEVSNPICVGRRNHTLLKVSLLVLAV